MQGIRAKIDKMKNSTYNRQGGTCKNREKWKITGTASRSVRAKIEEMKNDRYSKWGGTCKKRDNGKLPVAQCAVPVKRELIKNRIPSAYKQA